jgi:hypothetical protein
VDRTVNGIDFHSGLDIESRLLESETQTARARKKIDANWPRRQCYSPKNLWMRNIVESR